MGAGGEPWTLSISLQRDGQARKKKRRTNSQRNDEFLLYIKASHISKCKKDNFMCLRQTVQNKNSSLQF